MGWEEDWEEVMMPCGEAVERPWAEEVRGEVEEVKKQEEEVRLQVVEVKGQGVMLLLLLMGTLLCMLVLD